MTKNIPETFPIELHPEDKRQIIEWISNQPEADFDTCINRRARWSYTVVDEGVVTMVTVTDRATGNKFTPKIDLDSI